MAYFAKLDENNVVLEVVSVDNKELLNPDGIEEESLGIAFLTNLFNYPNWLQTSYNARIRKNYAGEGFTYDPTLNAFIPPQPYPSWLLNTNSCQWEAPVPLPDDGKVYIWDESIINWKDIRND
jgi:hypothetical protein